MRLDAQSAEGKDLGHKAGAGGAQHRDIDGKQRRGFSQSPAGQRREPRIADVERRREEMINYEPREVYRGVQIQGYQTRQRIEGRVKPQIDFVMGLSNVDDLFRYVGDVSHPPEARMLAGKMLEAIFSTAAADRVVRPGVDLVQVRARVAGLEEENSWRSPFSYGCIADDGPRVPWRTTTRGPPGAIDRGTASARSPGADVTRLRRGLCGVAWTATSPFRPEAAACAVLSARTRSIVPVAGKAAWRTSAKLETQEIWQRNMWNVTPGSSHEQRGEAEMSLRRRHRGEAWPKVVRLVPEVGRAFKCREAPRETAARDGRKLNGDQATPGRRRRRATWAANVGAGALRMGAGSLRTRADPGGDLQSHCRRRRPYRSGYTGGTAPRAKGI